MLYNNFFIQTSPPFGNKSKNNRKLAVRKTQNSDNGRKIFQPNLISWSYLNLGKVALTHKKTNNNNPTFIKNHM